MSGIKNKKFNMLCSSIMLLVIFILGTYFVAEVHPPIGIIPPLSGPHKVVENRFRVSGQPVTPDQNTPPSTEDSERVTSITPKTTKQLPPLAPNLKLRLPLLLNDEVYPNITYRIAASTNDTFSDQPWEQLADVVAARSIPSGSYVPKIAVIDSGIALNHQDLSGLWLSNAGESGATDLEAPSRLNCTDRSLGLHQSCNNLDDNFDGVLDNETGPTTFENRSQLNCTAQGKALDKACNNIDDDNNQLIDDYQGYDFSNGDRSVLPGEVDASGEGVSHGTLVSGVIAAKNNNGTGIAGVAASAQLLPLQALEDNGSGYTLSIADAIYYAVSRDVDVINLSLGTNETDHYLKQAIDYANQQGVVVVAAAGNDGCACPTYPAAFSSAIAVGAVDASGAAASFSNQGSFVDITAPGTNLYTTSWSKANTTSLYRYASGTSLSTPVISGAVARLLGRNPDASPLQLKAMLYEQTSQSGMSSLRDSHRGYGLVKLSASLNRSITPLTSEMIYSFYAIRSGRETNQNWGRRESTKQTTFYTCLPGNGHAGLTVFELNRGGETLYTASEVDRDSAVSAGFVATRLADWCVLFDVDTPIIRSMNVYAELKNYYPKE